MRTQSLDTHPDAERTLIEVIRKASSTKRFRLVQSLTQSAWWSSIHAWLQSHPGAKEQEAALYLVTSCYGGGMAQITRAALEQDASWHVQPVDLLAVISPAVSVFHERGVPCYLGGSVASSLHGMQQMAQDIDLVVDLRHCSVPSLYAALAQHYLVDEQVTQRHTSFTLLHVDSLMKIDVVIPTFDAFDTAMRPLVREYILDERYPSLRVASVYEMILFKLQRYHYHEQAHPGGLMDDAEWNDIVGMLKVQGPCLDPALLEWWVKRLDIAITWRRAKADGGLSNADKEEVIGKQEEAREKKRTHNVHVS